MGPWCGRYLEGVRLPPMTADFSGAVIIALVIDIVASLL
jgi:hypothetical protein